MAEDRDLLVARVVLAARLSVGGEVGQTTGVDQEGGGGFLLLAFGRAIAHRHAVGVHLVFQHQQRPDVRLEERCACG